MSEGPLDESTIRPAAGHPVRAFRVAGLTLLHHPDPARVGEVARLVELLSGKPSSLSRSAPLFAAPGTIGGGAPLADPGVSRKPVVVRPVAGGGISIEPGEVELQIDGVPGREPRTLSDAQVEAGVVLELAGRVVVLLHGLGPPAPPTEALGLVGASEGLERTREDILRVADLDVPVLLRGETGTGKELAARALHARGKRRNGPFVSVNMAAVPPETAVSELFGHLAGAFTGATRTRDGHFVEASGGTLFLDEIADLPSEVQSMLLRALDSGEIQQLGASRPRRVDVRLIAATDADLEDRMASGGFREQLFHRLAGYQLFLPPLRERRDDLGRLLQHFLREELQNTGELRRLEPSTRGRPLWLPAELVSRLARHSWPGNVRQLRNVVRQIVISSRGLEQVRVDSTVAGMLAESASPRPAPAARGPITDELLLETLQAQQWKTGAAAEALGISRTTLYALIDRSPRIRKARDLPLEEIRACLAECGGDLDAAAERLRVSKRALQLRLRGGGP